MVAWILVIIGGLNWLLVGLGDFLGSNWDVVYWVFGTWSMQVQWIVYILIGLAAVYELVMHRGDCKMCSSGTTPMM